MVAAQQRCYLRFVRRGQTKEGETSRDSVDDAQTQFAHAHSRCGAVYAAQKFVLYIIDPCYRAIGSMLPQRGTRTCVSQRALGLRSSGSARHGVARTEGQNGRSDFKDYGLFSMTRGFRGSDICLFIVTHHAGKFSISLRTHTAKSSQSCNQSFTKPTAVG